MKTIILKLTVFVTIIMMVSLGLRNVAYASDMVELDTSEFPYFRFIDDKFVEEYGADYRTDFPYALVFTQSYDDGGFYGGVRTYCIISTKPLRYDENEQKVVGSASGITVHAVCSFSKTYGSQVTALGDGGLYALASMPYSANYEIKDTTGTVVFQGALLQTKLAQITAQATKERNPMSQVVCLVPLGIFLVASFLGLRKALAILSKVLQQS